ncbi:MAG: hypothetical protein NVS4B10_21700 [Myxococcales bacterium]
MDGGAEPLARDAQDALAQHVGRRDEEAGVARVVLVRLEQRLDRPEALHAFTAGAAYAERAENRRGRIQAGYDADLTLFGRDLLGVPEAEIPRVPIAGTVVAGRLQERG